MNEQRLTRRQAAIIGAFTGIACGPFGDIQELGDELMGHSTWTHEYGDRAFAADLKERARPLLMEIVATPCYDQHGRNLDDLRTYDPAVYVLVRRDDLDNLATAVDSTAIDFDTNLEYVARTLIDDARGGMASVSSPAADPTATLRDDATSTHGRVWKLIGITDDDWAVAVDEPGHRQVCPMSDFRQKEDPT